MGGGGGGGGGGSLHSLAELKSDSRYEFLNILFLMGITPRSPQRIAHVHAQINNLRKYQPSTLTLFIYYF